MLANFYKLIVIFTLRESLGSLYISKYLWGKYIFLNLSNKKNEKIRRQL